MTEPLWTAPAAIAAMEGTSDRQDWSASGISIDSRTVVPGDLFVAIVGPHFDGHSFVAAALEAGAVAAVVTARPDGVPADAALVIVDDTLRAIERLGRAARARTDARVIAVTGSVGKTGTKEALRNILSCYGETHANPGSFNNHWGLPLTLARMPQSTEFAVLELGMNHTGELGPLSRMARPHVALITTIASNHIGNFTSLDEIADAKAEVFEGLEPDGWAILNQDDGYRDRLAAAAERLGAGHIISFGREKGANLRLLHCDLKPDSCRVTADIGGLPLTWDVGCAGGHWAMNSLGIMAVIQALSLNFRQATGALKEMQPPAGRGQRSVISLPDGTAELIDDSYNASPVSMRAAFDVLKVAAPGTDGRRIAVLGDMLELGDQAESEHRALADELLGRDIDLVFTCGPLMRSCSRALPDTVRGGHSPDSRSLAPRLVGVIAPGDVVLVKGSYGSRMSVVVDLLKNLNMPVAAMGG